MKTVVWLVRHGESVWAAEDRFNGLGDVELTERGRQQARRLADRLRARPLSVLYSSPLKRCLETASLLAAPHGLQPIPVEALAEFRTAPHRFDLVITDMTMPGLTGDQLVAKILRIRPDLPVIICTGFSERMDESTAADIGAKGLLMKPVIKAELSAAVRRALDGS